MAEDPVDLRVIWIISNKENSMVLRFAEEKETPRTVRFQEITESDAEPKVGYIYIKKTTLDRLGWKPGQEIVVTVEVTVE